MIIIRLSGGLGNQLFQYAFGRKLSLVHKEKVFFDIANSFRTNQKRQYLLAHYNLAITSINISQGIMLNLSKISYMLFPKFKLLGFTYNYEQLPKFNKLFLQSTNGYWEGFWQSEKYFIDIRNILLKEIQLKDKLPKTKIKIAQEIKKYNSVCIHVRRGDYVKESTANQVHGTCPLDYYKKAITLISHKLQEPRWFVFSDDMQWVKANLPLTHATYIAPDIAKPYYDLELMRLGKHFIIANSSFSWWGAWLATNPNKIVIAPKKWFKMEKYNNNDIIPVSWLRV